MDRAAAPPTDRIRLVIDDRERARTLIHALRRADCFETESRRLVAGDYLLDGRILIERKTVADLVDSIKSGRLFDQALRLAADERLVPVMILEGDRRSGARMSWASIQGALITVSVFIGVPVLRTRSPFETARTLRFLARQARAVASGALKRHGWRPKGKRALQNFILQGLPGIGPDRAAGLIDYFGSVRAVVSAPPDELRSVRGIGIKTADKIDWAVNEPALAWPSPDAPISRGPSAPA